MSLSVDSKIGVVIASYCRANLLRYSLRSIVEHGVPDGSFFVIVNDGDPNDATEEVCSSFSDKLDIRYVACRSSFSDYTTDHRSPVFAFNIAFRMAEEADIIVKSSSEMYSVNDCISRLAKAVELDPMAVAIPNGPDSVCFGLGRDSGGMIVHKLNSGHTIVPEDAVRHTVDLDVGLGYMMALRKDIVFELRGFDEDFTGYAAEDNDFVDRLAKYGCHVVNTSAAAIHLQHKEISSSVMEGFQDKLQHNNKLYHDRASWPVARNLGRDWGVLPNV